VFNVTDEVYIRGHEVPRGSTLILERGERVPRIDTLVRLADSAGARPAEVLDGIYSLPAHETVGTFTFSIGLDPLRREAPPVSGASKRHIPAQSTETSENREQQRDNLTHPRKLGRPTRPVSTAQKNNPSRTTDESQVRDLRHHLQNSNGRTPHALSLSEIVPSAGGWRSVSTHRPSVLGATG
jgi:hypothetical protein